MTIMAAACGILIVLLAVLSTGRSPTDGQLAIEITCLVGGLVLCFLAVVLARLTALGKRLDTFEIHFQAAAEDRAAMLAGRYDEGADTVD